MRQTTLMVVTSHEEIAPGQVTGQNPQSSRNLAQTMVRLLRDGNT